MNFILEDIITKYIKLNVMTRSLSLPIKVKIDTVLLQICI